MELIKNLKETSIVKNLFIAILGSILLAISAKIKIPFYPVPMTMQTFVVLLLGISLGWKLGLFTVVLYLVEGIAGLPVFAGTPEKGMGIVYFTGPTMGYLIGFLAAVYLTGFFTFDNNFFKNFAKLLFSVSFIYLLGLIWLGSLIGWDKPVFKLGAQPFLLAELFKILLLALLIPKVLKFRKL
jgi:biotin transport system substrate-specific component